MEIAERNSRRAQSNSHGDHRENLTEVKEEFDRHHTKNLTEITKRTSRRSQREIHRYRCDCDCTRPQLRQFGCERLVCGPLGDSTSGTTVTLSNAFARSRAVLHTEF
jgi:hypothetical protein